MGTAKPRCNRFECFANKCGVYCEILTERPDECSFYKTLDQVEQERFETHKRLKNIGREDLIKKYEYNSYRKW